ncbi:MAG: PQQ-dependent sugar dehydrogenase [Chloroherpetonaceae bacterium]|nr:PQQ-dependent sugar dehydrogenase [Chloroherpetonaceae bacterium]MDW8438293.1 PQQ-dependent sugar dehydrogenase [Chloroherpetonaceae bacterium]
MKKHAFALLLTWSALSFRANAQYSLVDAYPNLPNFSNAVEIVKANDGTNRLFVVQQRGLIYVFEDSPTVSVRKVFLDLSSVVSQTGSETGLLGMALHPNFAQNRTFFVHYTTGSPLRTEIARVLVSAQNPDSAVASSRQVIFTESQPYSNHNGGKIEFGPDGYLYISLGDGGSAGDPQNRAQNLNTTLGKLLRIDVDNVQSPLNYAIPPTNPFVGQANARPEIFAWGLRNTWKFCFDEQGRIWGADVGQNAWEEINIITRGGNYGWRKFEGNAVYNAGDPTPPNAIFPIWVYSHSAGDVSITGGYVYRGSRIPALYGKYIYGDYSSRRIWALTYDFVNPATNEFLLQAPQLISSFGEDHQNEILVVGYNSTAGRIRRLVSSTPAPLFSVNRAARNFGLVPSLEQQADTLILRNHGNAPLVISSIATQTPFFTVSKSSTTIAPNSSDTLTIIFRPTAIGNYADTLTMQSNAAPPTIRIPLFGQGDAPLSVEYSSFVAIPSANGVKLLWETCCEINNAGFEVQRRSDLRGASHQDWQAIGFVRGSGSTSEIRRYSFFDNAAPSGTLFYRLKQMSFGGAISYSPVVEVVAGAPTTFALNQNYPNPFNPETRIGYRLPVAANVKLELYDALGRRLATLVDARQEAGAYLVALNAQALNLASGVYFYRLQAGTFIETKKMILTK